MRSRVCWSLLGTRRRRTRTKRGNALAGRPDALIVRVTICAAQGCKQYVDIVGHQQKAVFTSLVPEKFRTPLQDDPWGGGKSIGKIISENESHASLPSVAKITVLSKGLFAKLFAVLRFGIALGRQIQKFLLGRGQQQIRNVPAKMQTHGAIGIQKFRQFFFAHPCAVAAPRNRSQTG